MPPTPTPHRPPRPVPPPTAPLRGKPFGFTEPVTVIRAGSHKCGPDTCTTDPCDVPQVPPSADIRDQVARERGKALLAFSRGKDSIAACLAMLRAGIQVYPYFMHAVPALDQDVEWVTVPGADGKPVSKVKGKGTLRGLRFIEEDLDRWEEFFARECGTHLLRLMHPSFYRKLFYWVHQPPERCSVIDAAKIIVPTYEDIVAIVRAEYGLPADTWVCDGVRAADSNVRRIAMASHGPINRTANKIHIVWDWRKVHIRESLAYHNVVLPIDYDWWGRSFDGIDYRFLEPLSRFAPDDYDRVLDWFPLAPLVIKRQRLSDAAPPYPLIEAAS